MCLSCSPVGGATIERHLPVWCHRRDTITRVVRDVFRCKPGKAAALTAKLKLALQVLETEEGFVTSRALIDP